MVSGILHTVVALCLLGGATADQSLAYAKQKGVDYDYTSYPPDQQYRTDVVVEQFRFAWNGYYEHAFPADQLNPVSLNATNPYGGWGASAVDGLDTAIAMSLDIFLLDDPIDEVVVVKRLGTGRWRRTHINSYIRLRTGGRRVLSSRILIQLLDRKINVIFVMYPMKI